MDEKPTNNSAKCEKCQDGALIRIKGKNGVRLYCTSCGNSSALVEGGPADVGTLGQALALLGVVDSTGQPISPDKREAALLFLCQQIKQLIDETQSALGRLLYMHTSFTAILQEHGLELLPADSIFDDEDNEAEQ